MKRSGESFTGDRHLHRFFRCGITSLPLDLEMLCRARPTRDRPDRIERRGESAALDDVPQMLKKIGTHPYLIFVSAPRPRIAASSIRAQVESAGTLVDTGAVTGAVLVLLPELGSEVALVTPAPLLIVPVAPGAAVVTMVKVPVPPDGNDGAVQVIVPVEPADGVVQFQPGGGVIDWKRSDDGSVSVKTRFDAPSGPPLVSVKV